MNMQDLAGRVQAGHIDALHLVSLEGGIYVLEAQMGDRAYPVEDESGRPLSLRSVEHARQVLRGMARVPVEPGACRRPRRDVWLAGRAGRSRLAAAVDPSLSAGAVGGGGGASVLGWPPFFRPHSGAPP